MATPREITSIALLEEDTNRENIKSETNTPVVENVTEAQEAPGKEPKQKTQRQSKREMKNKQKGITSSSPIVRLLDDEKRFIKKLEAHILLETDEPISDHQLIMDAVREYSKKHHPDFNY